jgi:predicted nucleotidyltransferase
MNLLIKNKITELKSICARRKVSSLALFGSAAKGNFDSTTSDLDFLVTFKSMRPSEHADNFFGLLEDLEMLFGVPIDLVEESTLKNPYFRKSVEESVFRIYDAA